MDDPAAFEDAVRAKPIPPTGWLGTLAIFGGGATLLFVATRVLLPAIREATGIEPILLWFGLGGALVFLPLSIAAYVTLRAEGRVDPRTWRERLRFRALDRGDWAWGIGALLAIAASTAGVALGIQALFGSAAMQPAFMTLEPIWPDRLWILAVWIPFWILNIGSEELLWRGVLLPRQEVALGRHAWIANAAGWAMFHVAFGWQLLLSLSPILIILPYVVQRRRNATVGLLIHAGLNGPGFLAVAFGLV